MPYHKLNCREDTRDMLYDHLIDIFSDFHSGNKTAYIVDYGAIVVICVMGLISNNVNYFSSIIGFIIGDKIGEKEGCGNRKDWEELSECPD